MSFGARLHGASFADAAARSVPTVLRFFAVLAAAAFTTSALALTFSWTGATSDRWSDPSNWNPIGLPQAGDNLAFPSGVARTTMTNDIAGAPVFNRLQFNAQFYSVNGNAVALSAGIAGGVGNTFNVPITLTGDASVDGGTFNGPIDVGTHALAVVNGNFPTQARFNGAFSGTGRIDVTSTTTPVISGSHSFSGVLTGPLALDAALFPNASIQLSPTAFFQGVSGNGSVGGAVTTTRVEPGSKSSPAIFTFDQPGVLNFGSLALRPSFSGSATMSFDIAGNAPGSGYDQVVVGVGGAVSLAPPVAAPPTNPPAQPQLSVTIASSFAPALNQVFTLIDNRGSTAIEGQFVGLPEGATISVGAFQFRVSYVGGDGNDVTLTCTLAPNVWSGAASGLWSNPPNWSGGVPTAGARLSFPPGARTAMTNDLAGLALDSLAFTGQFYQLDGNALTLIRGITGGIGNTFNVPLTLTGDASVDGGTFNGPIDVGGRSLTVVGGSSPTQVRFTGSFSGTGRIALMSNSTTVISGAHSFAGVLVGAMALDGALFPNASIESNPAAFFQLVMGNGTVGGAVTTSRVEPSSRSSPAFLSFDRPGVLNFGSLALRGLFSSTPAMTFDIAGSVPGTGYDQVVVGGAVSLAIMGTPQPQLTVNVASSFTPSLGQVFTLIDNRGSNPIEGQFAGLPEGATIAVGAFQFRLSYAGGDGNDVTLTCTLAPNVWSGAVNGLWSNAANWSGGVPVAGARLSFPPGGRGAMTNDRAGLALDSLAFTGQFYQLGGNGISLAKGIIGGVGNTFNLPITFTGDASVDGGTFNGPIDVGTHTLAVVNSNFPTQARFNGAFSGTGRIDVTSTTTPVISGTHSFSGVLTGPLGLDGALFPNAAIQLSPSAFFQGVFGNGTVGGALLTSRVEPGSKSSPAVFSFDQPGVLNFGSLTLRPSFSGPASMSLDIAGNTPGTGYDQVVVGGAVILAPPPSVVTPPPGLPPPAPPAPPQLSVTMSPSWVPTRGETYVLLDNRGSAPITGTFAGLPEGSIVTLLNVYTFRLSYVGGDGNDIVLVSLNGKDPTNTMLLSSANPSTPAQTVTFTATVNGTHGTPTGTITFREGSTVLAFVPLSGGSASFTTSSLPAGAHYITAQYGGDANNGGSTSPVVTQLVAATGGTTAGSDVPVTVNTTLPGGATTTVDIHFANVSSAGVTTVTATTGGPTPPTGYQVGNPPVYYDVTTTATFSGQVTLCFGWTEGQFADEGAVALFHFENGAWKNVTTSLDTVANSVCGRTTSLSPFALMQLQNTAPTAVSTSVSTRDGVPVSVALSGSDNESAQVSFSISQQPAHGTLGALSAPACTALAQGGTCTATVVYTPVAGYTGPDSFRYTTSDGSATSGAATVSITVNPKLTPVVSLVAPANATFGSTFVVTPSTQSTARATVVVDAASASVCSIVGTSVTMTSGSGTCALTASWPADDTFAAATARASVTAQRVGTGVTVIAPSVTYDGAPHGAEATASAAGLSAPLAVTYSGAGATSYGPSSQPPADAGSYVASAAFAGDANYAPSSGQQPFSIQRAPSSIAILAGPFTYDGNAHSASAVVSGSGTGVTQAAAITYGGGTQAPTNAGSYPVMASYAGDSNHEASVATGMLVIAPAAAQVEYTGLGSLSTLSPASLVANVLSSATLKVPAGDISGATLTFTSSEQPGGIAGCTHLPVRAFDAQTATATCEWQAARGNTSVAAVLDAGNYAAPASTIALSVAAAVKGAGMTGSASVVLSESVGRFAGSSAAFDVSAKFTGGSANELQGALHVALQQGSDVYTFDATELRALSVSGAEASMTGAGTIAGVGGGYRFQLRTLDAGEPGVGRDAIALTVWDASGALVLSTRWTGMHTETVPITSGNLQSH